MWRGLQERVFQKEKGVEVRQGKAPARTTEEQVGTTHQRTCGVRCICQEVIEEQGQNRQERQVVKLAATMFGLQAVLWKFICTVMSFASTYAAEQSFLFLFFWENLSASLFLNPWAALKHVQEESNANSSDRLEKKISIYKSFPSLRSLGISAFQRNRRCVRAESVVLGIPHAQLPFWLSPPWQNRAAWHSKHACIFQSDSPINGKRICQKGKWDVCSNATTG